RLVHAEERERRLIKAAEREALRVERRQIAWATRRRGGRVRQQVAQRDGQRLEFVGDGLNRGALAGFRVAQERRQRLFGDGEARIGADHGVERATRRLLLSLGGADRERRLAQLRAVEQRLFDGVAERERRCRERADSGARRRGDRRGGDLHAL